MYDDRKTYDKKFKCFWYRNYLNKIYENHGQNGLQNALISLSSHLDYYKNISNTRVLKRHKIYNKYLEKLNVLSQIIFPDEIDETEKFIEGKSKKVFVNVYERNTSARIKCIEYYGYKCQICEFDFEKNMVK